MPTFGASSKSRLRTCHPDLIVLMNEVVKNYDCIIVCGYRTKEDQEKAFREGKSKNRYPGKHNTKPCIAVDAAPYESGAIDWSLKQSAHFAGYVRGVADTLYNSGEMKHKIRSGADWNSDNDVDDTTFWDACHFELIPNDGEVFNYYPI